MRLSVLGVLKPRGSRRPSTVPTPSSTTLAPSRTGSPSVPTRCMSGGTVCGDAGRFSWCPVRLEDAPVKEARA